jgi:hypothetical protein
MKQALRAGVSLRYARAALLLATIRTPFPLIELNAGAPFKYHKYGRLNLGVSGYRFSLPFRKYLIKKKI